MMRTFRVTVDGTPYEVTVEETTEGNNRLYPDQSLGRREVQRSARSVIAAPESSAAAPAPAAPAAAGDEPSPLAGVVVSVEVKEGQAVSEGDRLVVIEAMKMKSVVFAHRAGNVTKVHVEPGQGVDAGQILVSIG